MTMLLPDTVDDVDASASVIEAEMATMEMFSSKEVLMVIYTGRGLPRTSRPSIHM
jgi:hypothetical protein